jgi:hypothetical protein
MDEVVQADIQGSGTVATMPSPDAPAPLPDFMSVVPEKFKEAQWVKDTAKSEKPFEAFFSQFENAQKTIGEKSKALEIPGADATPEKVAEFRKALGVPDKPEGYEYTPPDISKEPEAVQKILKERESDQTFMNTMRQKALDAGITPAQFKTLAAEFDGLTVAQVKAQVQGQAQALETLKTQRNENLAKLYGDNAPAYIRQADETLLKAIPESIRKLNDPGLALIEALRIINDKVYKSDVIGTTNQGAPELTMPQLRARIVELTSKPEYANKFAPGHSALKHQVDQLYIEEDRLKKNKIE